MIANRDNTMKATLQILAATSAIALLSACGGGGSTPSNPGGDGGTPTPAPSYETLTSSASKTSTLGGVALRSNNTTGAMTLTTTSGSVTHNTGATTISDGTYTLTDNDGSNTSGVISDGSSTLTAGTTNGTYDYVLIYDQTYTSGGTSYDSAGIGGIVTNAADVPTSGTANYTGEAEAFVVTATQGFDLLDGKSTVAANFGAGTVNVTMNGFTAEDAATGNPTTAPIDTISVTGMAIAGNGFSGGTIATTNAGSAVNLTGANTTSAAQGAFFGYDAAISAPDEVGGLILLQGDDGVVAGGFIAD